MKTLDIRRILFILAATLFLPFIGYAEDDASMLMSKLRITTDANIRQEIYAQLCALYRDEPEEISTRVKAINDANENGLKPMAMAHAAYICRNYYQRNMLDSMSVWIKYVTQNRLRSQAAYFYAKSFEVQTLISRNSFHLASTAANTLKREAAKLHNVQGRILADDLLGDIAFTKRNFNEAAAMYGEALSLLTDGTHIDVDHVVNILIQQTRTLTNLGRTDEALMVLHRFNNLIDSRSIMNYEGYDERPDKYKWDTIKLYLDIYLKRGDATKIEEYYQKLVKASAEESNQADLGYNFLRAKYFANRGDVDNAMFEIDYILARAPRIDVELLFFKSSLLKRLGDRKAALNMYKVACDSLQQLRYTNLTNDVRMMAAGKELNVLNFVAQDEYEKQTSIVNTALLIVMGLGIILLILSILIFLRHKNMSRKIAAANANLERDRNELKAVTDDLEKAYQRAEYSNIKRNEFLQTVSHEVRTPLNAIVGFSQMILEDNENVDDTEKEYVHIIMINSDLMLKLVNDILDLSQLDSSGVNINIAPVNMLEVAENVVNAIKPLAKEDVSVTLTHDEGESMIYTDRFRLQQLLTNLLGNSAKFTKRGNINLDIQHSNKMIQFSVSDTGCGIAPEERSRLFHRYEKLDEAAKGTGLGLYISMLISRKLGGLIYLDKSYEHGARFVFEHPTRLQFGQRLINDENEDDREGEEKL